MQAPHWLFNELDHAGAEHLDANAECVWILEPMLEHAGLRIIEREHSDSRIYAAYTCVRALVDAP